MTKGRTSPKLEEEIKPTKESRLEQQSQDGLYKIHSEVDLMVDSASVRAEQLLAPDPSINVSSQTSHGDENSVTAGVLESQDEDDNVLPSEVTRMSFSPELDEEGPFKLYEIVSQVGEGTFGKVFKARNIITGSHVALKRIRMEGEKDGFPVTAMREIKLLQSLNHINVIRLHEMMVSQGRC